MTLAATPAALLLTACLFAACAAEAVPVVATDPPDGTARGTQTAAEEPQVKLGEKPRDPEARRKDAIGRARQHLYKTIKVEPDEISVESAIEARWPDASLGCPEKDRMYAQVVTEGYKVILRARGATHELHVGPSRVVECKNQQR